MLQRKLLNNNYSSFILLEVAYKHFRTDDSIFENAIKDWFRHGSQRLAREGKRQ